MARMKIQYDDEGNAFLGEEEVSELLTPYEQKIQQLEYAIAMARAGNVYEAQGRALLDGVIGQKAHYSTAYERLNLAHKELNELVRIFQQEHGLEGYMSPHDASVLLEGTEYEDEFNRLHPDVDMTDALFYNQSEAHLKRALDNVSETLDIVPPEPTAAEKIAPKLDVGAMVGLSDKQYSDDAVDKLIDEMRKDENPDDDIMI